MIPNTPADNPSIKVSALNTWDISIKNWIIIIYICLKYKKMRLNGFKKNLALQGFLAFSNFNNISSPS